MIFREGEWYDFKITNQTEVPDKGFHYVLQHTSGRKILLLMDNYVKYNLRIGSSIECRVDKINCTGQIFMEPKHPFYNIGESYKFKILTNSPLESHIEVEDLLGNRIQVYLPQNIKTDKDELILKVINTKKGKPVLALPNISTNCDENIEVDGSICALISEIFTLNGEEFFKLKINNDCFGLLKVKHYKGYGFKVGGIVSCKYLGSNPDGSAKIEPINPNYTIGDIYKFKVEGFQEITDIENDTVIIAEVLDVSNRKCGVKLPNKVYLKGQTINCKVTGYRKGRPQLEISE